MISADNRDGSSQPCEYSREELAAIREQVLRELSADEAEKILQNALHDPSAKPYFEVMEEIGAIGTPRLRE